MNRVLSGSLISLSNFQLVTRYSGGGVARWRDHTRAADGFAPETADFRRFARWHYVVAECLVKYLTGRILNVNIAQQGPS